MIMISMAGSLIAWIFLYHMALIMSEIVGKNEKNSYFYLNFWQTDILSMTWVLYLCYFPENVIHFYFPEHWLWQFLHPIILPNYKVRFYCMKWMNFICCYYTRFIISLLNQFICLFFYFLWLKHYHLFLWFCW